jgi:UDP-2,3-diacylglucosamine pyrophosphatase LpxH
MLSDIRNYIRKMTAERKAISFSLVMAGILLPLIFLSWAFSTHNAVDNTLDYSPTRFLFLAIGATSLLVLIAASIDLIMKARRKDKKYDFPSIYTSIICLASILMTVVIASYVVMPQLLRSGDTPPQLIITESDSGFPGLAVVFNTDDPTINTIEYRAMGGESRTLKEDRAVNQHWFQLSGLEPDKSYEYSINGADPVGFKTPPASRFTFAASGDPHFGAELSRSDLTRKMVKGIKDSNSSMLFVLGDTAQYGFSDRMWKEAFDSISPTSSTMPTEYVIGNHDAMFGGAGLYEDYLCPPGLMDPEKNCLTKRIDNGNVHFLILDVEWELQSYTPEQKKWLAEQLSSIPKEDWCIVMSHTFYYSSGSEQYGWDWYDNNSTIRELTPLFENNSVDLVLSGHKHHTELLEKNNVTYVVVGSFGGPPDAERTYVSPASIWYKQGAYDFASVTIENQTIATIRFIDSNQTELFRWQIRNRD